MNIKDLCAQKNITIEELAKQLGVSSRQIRRWQAETSNITQHNLCALADYFECTADELLGRVNFGTGLVEVKGEQLNDDEKKIIANYRFLDKSTKKSFVEMSDSIAKAHGAKK